MSDVKIQPLVQTSPAGDEILREMEGVFEIIRQRAFDLFSRHGFREGRALEDWLAAEREVCWPAAELVEDGKDYILTVGLPGYAPQEVSVTAAPGELMIHARRESSSKGTKSERVCWSEFGSNDVYRRITLPQTIDASSVAARLGNGLLTIRARRSETDSRNVPVAVAA